MEETATREMVEEAAGPRADIEDLSVDTRPIQGRADGPVSPRESIEKFEVPVAGEDRIGRGVQAIENLEPGKGRDRLHDSILSRMRPSVTCA